MRLSDLRGRTVAVWGAGREGRAAVTAIAAHGPADLVAVGVEDGDTGQVRDEDPRSASRHGPRHLLLGDGRIT